MNRRLTLSLSPSSREGEGNVVARSAREAA